MEIERGILVMVSSKYIAGSISNHCFFWGIVIATMGDQEKTIFSLYTFTPDGRFFTTGRLIDQSLMIPVAELSGQKFETISHKDPSCIDIRSIVTENICEIISSLVSDNVHLRQSITALEADLQRHQSRSRAHDQGIGRLGADLSA
jgi:hypothetical protein